MTKLLPKVAIANRNRLVATIGSPSITNPPKKRLVADWLVDENSKLYCKWITQD